MACPQDTFFCNINSNWAARSSFPRCVSSKTDDWDTKSPYLLFYVDSKPPPAPPEDDKPEDDKSESGNGVESRVVKRSKDGLNIVREHVFRARL